MTALKKLLIDRFFLIFLVSVWLFFGSGLINVAQAEPTYGAALKGITTVLFIAFFTLIAAITLLALAVMLIIRYVWLTILLILSPIVWLLWIFPGTKSYWQKWWDNFIKWAIFAPIVLFFLYLTIFTINEFPAAIVEQAGGNQNLSNQTFTIDVAYIGNLVAIAGLLLGGLFAANYLGIAGAKTFYGWAGKSGKAFGGWVGRKGIRAGTWPLRKKFGGKGEEKTIPEYMQGIGIGRGWALRGLTLPIRKAGEFGAYLRDVGIKQIRDAEVRFEKIGRSEDIALQWGTADTPERIAILEVLRKRKDVELLLKAGVKLEEIAKTLGHMIEYRQRVKNVTEVVPILDRDVLQAMMKKDFGEMGNQLTGFLKELVPGKWALAQWRDIIRGEFKGPLSQAEWDNNALPEVVKAALKAATAEAASGLFRSFRQNERALFQGEMLKQVDEAARIAGKAIPTNHAERIAIIQDPAIFNNPSLAKFLDSDLSKDLGLRLE